MDSSNRTRTPCAGISFCVFITISIRLKTFCSILEGNTGAAPKNRIQALECVFSSKSCRHWMIRSRFLRPSQTSVCPDTESPPSLRYLILQVSSTPRPWLWATTRTLYSRSWKASMGSRTSS